MLLHLFSKVNLWIQFGNRNKNRNAYVHSYRLITRALSFSEFSLSGLWVCEHRHPDTHFEDVAFPMFLCFCSFSVLHLKVFKILREVAHREDAPSWSSGCLVVFWSLDLSLPLFDSEYSAHPKTVMPKPAHPGPWVEGACVEWRGWQAWAYPCFCFWGTGNQI